MEQSSAVGVSSGNWLVVGSASSAAALTLSCSDEAGVVVSNSSIWHSFSHRLHLLGGGSGCGM